MDLLNSLLNSDANLIEETSTKKVKSRRLKKILKSDEDVFVTIRELSARAVTKFIKMQYDKKGNMDFDKNLTAKTLICVEGITEPNLRDKGLLSHFGCNTPSELCEKLFQNEITAISDEILILSGVTDEEDEAESELEEIKNA